MEIGLGLDSRLGLPIATLRDLAADAADAGYGSLWTNAGVDYDPVAMCIAWHAGSGLRTGVSVVPIQRNPPAVLALAARTAHELTGGAFTLGIGSGSVSARPIAAVRDYVAEVRKTAADVPIVVGALGPQMLRLAGTISEGAALNWCTPAQVAWSRERAGGTKMIQYIRVCVDDDVPAARTALALQILAYALMVRPSGSRGYRAHFERMGFAEELSFLETRKAVGAKDDELARVMPDRLLATFGYAGRGDGAKEWFADAARGLDVAIVRVLNPRPGDPKAVHSAIAAFAP